MDKYKLSALSFVFIAIIFSIFSSIANAEILFSSRFLSDDNIASKIVSNDTREYLNSENRFYGFLYKFLSGVSMTGIETYNKSPFESINQFRIENKIEGGSPYITQVDIIALDKLLKYNEDLDNRTISFFEKLFNHIKIHSSNDSLMNHYKSEVYKILSYLPESHTDALYKVKIHDNLGGYNAYAGHGDIIIRGGHLIGSEKFRNTFLHEMGHIVDTSYYGDSHSGHSRFIDQGINIYNDDPVLEFFNLSWNNHINKKHNYSNNDFVSYYAMENPFEDFAESYGMYVANGNTFRCVIGRSEVLMQKYLFLKDEIFYGREYYTGAKECTDIGVVDDATDL